MKSHTLLVYFSLFAFSTDGSVELEGRKEVVMEYAIMYCSKAFIVFTFECTVLSV